MRKAEMGRREELIYIWLLLNLLRFQPKEKFCWQVSLRKLYFSTKHNVFFSPLLHLFFFCVCMLVPEAYLLFISPLIELSTVIKFPKHMWKLTCSQLHHYCFSILMYCLFAQLQVLCLHGSFCKSKLTTPNL